MSDLINNPAHYNQGDIECIDAIRAALSEEEFCGYLRGNIPQVQLALPSQGRRRRCPQSDVVSRSTNQNLERCLIATAIPFRSVPSAESISTKSNKLSTQPMTTSSDAACVISASTAGGPFKSQSPTSTRKRPRFTSQGFAMGLTARKNANSFGEIYD